MNENKGYTLYFDAYGQEGKTIQAQINGETFDADITDKKKTFKFNFKTGNSIDSRDLKFLLGSEGVTYIDNVRLEENSLIRNGEFNSGTIGWELFADGGLLSKPSCAVDTLKEDNAVQITIEDTSDADWKIQLKQSNVKLEEGKKYKLSFDAKSTIERDIMYAIQRDGSKDNNWDAYTDSNVVKVRKDFNTYELPFEMKKTTDNNSIFTISMGAVKDTQINDKHIITIDNVKLEEVVDKDS